MFDQFLPAAQSQRAFPGGGGGCRIGHGKFFGLPDLAGELQTEPRRAGIFIADRLFGIIGGRSCRGAITLKF